MKFCKTLKEKVTAWYMEFLITPQKSPTVVVQHIKSPAWAIKKQPAERGKRAVHFRCFLHKIFKQLGNRG